MPFVVRGGRVIVVVMGGEGVIIIIVVVELHFIELRGRRCGGERGVGGQK